MNVTAPDGTVITDVPDGTTKAQFLAKWQGAQKKPASPPDPHSLAGANAAIAKSFGDVWGQVKSDTGEAVEGFKKEFYRPQSALDVMVPGSKVARVLSAAFAVPFAPLHGALKGSLKKDFGETGSELMTDIAMLGVGGKTGGKALGAGEEAGAARPATEVPKPAIHPLAEGTKKAAQIPGPPSTEPEKPKTTLPALVSPQKPLALRKPPEGMEGWPGGEPDPHPKELTDSERNTEAFKMGRNLDHVLYRVTGNNEADQSRMLEYLNALPDKWNDPKFQEMAYRQMEEPLRTPGAKPADSVQEFMNSDFGKLYNEQGTLWKDIKKLQAKYKWGPGSGLMTGEEEFPDTTAGYVHRIGKDKGSVYDQGTPGTRDPITGAGRTLSKEASAMHGRKFYVLEDAQGKRTFVPRQRLEEIEKKTGPVTHGKQYAGDSGSKYTAKQATTDEIEQATKDPRNGYKPMEYHKNLLVSTIDNVMRLRKIKRNIIVAQSLKDAAEQKGLMYWGDQIKHAPEGYIGTNMPQFFGAKMHPSIAASLNDFYGELPADMGPLEKLEAMNRFLTRTIFFNPLPHLGNVAASWMISRGSDWARPSAYASLVRTGAQAINQVVKQGPVVRALLRQGAGLQYPRIANQNFLRLMLKRAGVEIDRDPHTWSDLAKEFGLAAKEFAKDTSGFGQEHSGSPSELVRKIYDTSSKAMWLGSDIMMVQRIMELMGPGGYMRGKSIDDAIRIAAKDIPDYKIPSQMWNSKGAGGRIASAFLKSPDYIMFGRYKYDQAKLIGNLARDLVAPNATREERQEALAKAVIMGLFTTAVYPLADSALKKITGQQDLKFKRFGPFSITDEVMKNIQGQEGFVEALAHIISPSPGIDIASDVVQQFQAAQGYGKDAPIFDPHASTLGKATQTGEYALSRVAPGQEVEQAMRPGGLKHIVARNIGLAVEPKGQSPRAARYARKSAARREGSDPIEQMIRKAFSQ